MKRRVWIAVLVLIVLVAFSAYARVGGGESYSGGGSSSGGGSYSGGGSSSGGGSGDISGCIILIFQIFKFLVWLTLEHPLIGIPVDLVLFAGVVMWLRTQHKDSLLTLAAAREAAAADAAVPLEALRRFDPNFSEITFSDFCYSLYARAHYARAAGDLGQYAPFISDHARAQLQRRNVAGLSAVRGVIVGAFRPSSLRGLDTNTVTVSVDFDANYTEDVNGTETAYYVSEQWRLQRFRDILSPAPEKAKADHCPRCGAALQTRTDGACNYCGVKVEGGAFQWYVIDIRVLKIESRGPLLTSNVPESGTDRPTVRSHGLEAFAAEWPALEQRVREVAYTLQDAWTARDWEKVRPLETESLFQMHRYWIDAYLRQNLRNIVADFKVTHIELAKVTHDAFYEAATVRIFAEGRDHTVDASGRVVGGSAQQLRRWSEYWTFVRTRRAGPGSTLISCPNCGASVNVGATGVCEYCGGKLTAGHFDWVLSRIEQDEEYRG